MTALPDTDAAPISRRQVAAAVVGNALEFYDFTTYAYFAVQIGHAFFPGRSTFISLILSLATFGAGFILRPLGALVLGRFADRRGRRPAMIISFALMGVGIVGLAATPGYAVWGPVAPVLVVIWRLIQGFALGGEVGPTTAYLVEAAPPHRRGLYAAWQGASQNLAAIAGGSVGVLLSALLGEAALDAWGWRLAFGIGALILPIGLLLRRDLPETLHRPEPAGVHQPDRPHLRAHGRVIALGLALVAAATVATYALTYMTTYARQTLQLGSSVSLAAPIFNGAAGTAFGLAGGWLSDRFGRRPLLIWPRLVFLVCLWPVYAAMAATRSPAVLLAGIFLLAGLSALTTAAAFVAITEGMRKEVRGLAFGGVYALAVAIFGGLTQPAIAGLIQVTHDPLSPAWLVMAFTAVGMIASLATRETAAPPRRSAPRT